MKNCLEAYPEEPRFGLHVDGQLPQWLTRQEAIKYVKTNWNHAFPEAPWNEELNDWLVQQLLLKRVKTE